MITIKVTDKAKKICMLLREDMKKFPDTYTASSAVIGVIIASKGLFIYDHTNKYNCWMVAGLAISIAAIAYEILLLRKD